MVNQSILAFVVGSSVPVFITFFLSVQNLEQNYADRMNYSFYDYSLIAPIYLGLINLIGFILFKNNRFFRTGLLSGLIVALFAYSTKSYNLTNQQWLYYVLYIVSKHLLTFTLVVATLEKAILN